jgi:hypothetical protein
MSLYLIEVIGGVGKGLIAKLDCIGRFVPDPAVRPCETVVDGWISNHRWWKVRTWHHCRSLSISEARWTRRIDYMTVVEVRLGLIKLCGGRDFDRSWALLPSL